jgi:hypothetical protein
MVNGWTARRHGAEPVSSGAAVPDGRDDNDVVWVYAITANAAPELLSGLTGVAGEPVRAVTEADLSAVVGTVTDATGSGKPLASLLVGLTAIESAGRAHHEVVARLAADNPVLPLRLATVYPDDTTVRRLLGERHGELSALVESFRGTQEWGVKVFMESHDPLIGPAGEPDSPASLEPLLAQTEACVEEVGHALSDIAVATRRRPSPDPRFGADSGWLVLNGAYLLDAERAGEFAEIVESATAAHAGIRADVTGPWPPYSFVDGQELLPAA